MSLVDVIQALRTYWRSIVAVFLVVTLAGIGVHMLQSTRYTSQATVYLIPRAGGAAGQLSAAQEYAVTQSKTFANFVSSPAVMEPVHAKLGLGGAPTSLLGRVSASAPGETASIVLTASDTNPQFAHDLVAATADQVLITFEEYTAPGADQVLEAKIMQPASLPAEPSSPNFQRNLLMALGAAAALAVGQALLRRYLDSSVETVEDVARVSTHRVIGEVPMQGESKSSAFSQRGESYRRVRTYLQFLGADGNLTSMLVTSSIPGEGKTETSTSIARAMAEAGQRTLLIDGDLRRPQIAKHFDVENSVGLTSVLLEGLPLGEAVQRVEGMDVLTSGPIPSNPSEVLGTDRMRELLTEVEGSYDFVLVDTPPVLPVTDATLLAQFVDGVVMVADTQNVKRGQLKHALHNLDGVEATVLGVVLNKIKTSGGRYGSGYGYGYRYDYSSDGTGSMKRVKASGRRAKSARPSTEKSRTRRAVSGRDEV